MADPAKGREHRYDYVIVELLRCATVMGEMILAAKTGSNFDSVLSEAMLSQEGGRFSGASFC